MDPLLHKEARHMDTVVDTVVDWKSPASGRLHDVLKSLPEGSGVDHYNWEVCEVEDPTALRCWKI